MSAATFLSDRSPVPPIGLESVRVSGGVSIRCSQRLGESRIVDVGQRDGYKVRMPRRSAPPEAVIINTGGGVAGGDDVAQEIVVDDGAALTVTTQASERIYRSHNDAVTNVDVRASLGDGAQLNWLPQDTILFDGAMLRRRMTAEIAASARLLVGETVVFGRAAMGETLQTGLFQDQWRLKRDGRLVFAENILLRDETFRLLAAPVVAGAAQATLTLVLIAPDAEDRLAATRKVLRNAGFECAASAWNGMIMVRGMAAKVEAIRHLMRDLVPVLQGISVPRVWWT